MKWFGVVMFVLCSVVAVVDFYAGKPAMGVAMIGCAAINAIMALALWDLD